MFYRLCIPLLDDIYALGKASRWEHDQVHAEYPKTVGSFAPVFSTLSSALLGNRAPNISVVSESMTGFDCYCSIRDNQSDFTPILIGYPIKDFDKVKPIQVVFEELLGILSTYIVDEEKDIIYEDFLVNSLKSFDFTVWSIVVIVLFIFVGLLFLRKLFNSSKEDKKQGNDLADAPFLETFSHLIGQVSSNFVDRPGKVISLIMTAGFFLILMFYLNLMSTDLVVETQPAVIQNYRDIMNKDNYTVDFLARMPDQKEFEDATPGSIQDEFRTRMKNNVLTIDIGQNMTSDEAFVFNILTQKAVFMTSMFIASVRERMCKIKNALEDQGAFENKIRDPSRVYSWMSSDPAGKHHTTGLIMRQGLTTPLITKGLRRTRRLFEADIIRKPIAEAISNVTLPSQFTGKTDPYSILICMSDTIQSNQRETYKSQHRKL